MKKLVFLLFLLGQSVSAQYYGSYSYNNDNIIRDFIIQLLLMIIIFTGIFYAIAHFEGNKKSEDFISKEYNTEIWVWLVVSIVLVMGLNYLFYIKDSNPLIIILPTRIILATLTSYYAQRKNRNSVLWWFLGFLEYHSALIILALTKGLLQVKKGNTDADIAFNEKNSKLNELFNEGLINADELKNKKKELENVYSKNSNLIQKSIKNQQQNEYLTKLEDAYKQGFLTEEEYKSKIAQFEEVDVKEKVEEEKEKFRKLHEQRVITYDEMMTKFKQIENYHRNKNLE